MKACQRRTSKEAAIISGLTKIYEERILDIGSILELLLSVHLVMRLNILGSHGVIDNLGGEAKCYSLLLLLPLEPQEVEHLQDDDAQHDTEDDKDSLHRRLVCRS